MMAGSPQSVLIMGAAPSIGYRLAKRLGEAGLPVRALLRERARAAALDRTPNISLVQGDLRIPESLRGCMEDCSLVHHLATKLTGFDRAAFRAINVAGTQALLKETERSRVKRFMHASSIGVY